MQLAAESYGCYAQGNLIQDVMSKIVRTTGAALLHSCNDLGGGTGGRLQTVPSQLSSWCGLSSTRIQYHLYRPISKATALCSFSAHEQNCFRVGLGLAKVSHHMVKLHCYRLTLVAISPREATVYGLDPHLPQFCHRGGLYKR